MQYRKFGRFDIKVSALGFGCMRLPLAADGSINEPEAIRLIRDAIAQFLVPQEDWRGRTFCLDGREHLRQVQVAQTEVAAYAALMAGGGAP